MGKRRVIGQITRFKALDAFRDYVEGNSTLEEFRKCDVSIEHEPIYAESPDPEPLESERVPGERVLALMAAFGVGVLVGYVFTLF